MSILTLPASAVNFDLPAPAVAPEAEEPRPSYDFCYYPDLEEERDAREMFDGDGDDEPTDADWDAMADEAGALDSLCLGYAHA